MRCFCWLFVDELVPGPASKVIYEVAIVEALLITLYFYEMPNFAFVVVVLEGWEGFLLTYKVPMLVCKPSLEAYGRLTEKFLPWVALWALFWSPSLSSLTAMIASSFIKEACGRLTWLFCYTALRMAESERTIAPETTTVMSYSLCEEVWSEVLLFSFSAGLVP